MKKNILIVIVSFFIYSINAQINILNYDIIKEDLGLINYQLKNLDITNTKPSISKIEKSTYLSQDKSKFELNESEKYILKNGLAIKGDYESAASEYLDAYKINFNFTYKNDLITEINTISADGNDYIKYFYNADKTISKIEVLSYGEKMLYQVNQANSKITIKLMNSQNEVTTIYDYTFSNGKITEKEVEFLDYSSVENTNYSYTPKGKLTKQEYKKDNKLQKISTYTYNDKNDLEEVSILDYSDKTFMGAKKSSLKSEYIYDKFGNWIVRKTTSSGFLNNEKEQDLRKLTYTNKTITGTDNLETLEDKLLDEKVLEEIKQYKKSKN